MRKLSKYKLSREKLSAIFGGETSDTRSTSPSQEGSCTDVRTITDTTDGTIVTIKSDCRQWTCPDDAPEPGTTSTGTTTPANTMQSASTIRLISSNFKIG
jgi:hypothetical protein